MNRTTPLTITNIAMNICALCCVALMIYSVYCGDWTMAFFCAAYTIGSRIIAVCARDIKKAYLRA
jgi:hypothetical protein